MLKIILFTAITLTDEAGDDIGGTTRFESESNDPLQYCINLDTSPTTDMTVSLAGSPGAFNPACKFPKSHAHYD